MDNIYAGGGDPSGDSYNLLTGGEKKLFSYTKTCAINFCTSGASMTSANLCAYKLGSTELADPDQCFKCFKLAMTHTQCDVANNTCLP